MSLLHLLVVCSTTTITITIRCSKNWIGLLIAISIVTLISGLILVGLLLILNLTVSVATLNGTIFLC